jgi:subtilisin family serine protease
VGKLQLSKAHAIARGERVMVAVIDSGIDTSHPEFAGAIAKSIDVVEDGDSEPHMHGTAMAGAIVSKAQLTGVAPAAEVLAIRAFTASRTGGASSTSFQLVNAVDRAVHEGARVINLSFAGPADPMLSEALKRARGKNIVLIAAAGNAGPSSPPLYPAADVNVIAVTATDENDKIFTGANRGRHIAVAAPGVDVLVPEPRGSYGLSTGTSVAAAHVSGVAALILARNPSLSPEGVKQILRRSAQSLGSVSAEEGGAGLADAFAAITAAEQRPAPNDAPAGRRRR